MLVSNVAPTGALTASAASAPVALSPLPVQPACCGRCGCGGKVLALAGATNADPLAALRGITELG